MKKYLVISFCAFSACSHVQNDRVNDFNNTNWLQTFNIITLNTKWSLHAEYQWRRENGLKSGQQSLLRIGTNYKLNDNVIAHLGYAWVETFPYGDYPMANNGTFPEHRLYEQLTLRQPTGKLLFTHRFRYQFRTQYPFWMKGDKQFYGVAADEIFIGAGKNLGINIFDQNRIFLLLGYKLHKKVTLEAGYFNQTLQQGRRINNQTIMQRNNGVVVSSFINW